MAPGTRPPKPGDKLFKVKTSSLPRLRELREDLGYGTTGRPEDIAFKKVVRAHIEKFVSEENLPATEFKRWTTAAHQKGLVELTKNFLHAEGKGLEFWPDDPNSPNKRPLEYTRDCEQIQRLMVKLFYRTIIEYKRYTTTVTNELTQNIPASSGPPALGGHSVDNPIDLESMEPPTNAPRQSVDNDPFNGRSYDFGQFEPIPYNDMPDGLDAAYSAIQEAFELSTDRAPPQVSRNGIPGTRDASDTHNSVTQNSSGTDPYDVPNSPREAAPTTQNRDKRPAEQPEPTEDSRRAQPPRQEQHNSGEESHQPISGPAPQKGKKRPRRPPGEKTRFSKRAKKPTRRPDFAGSETADDLIPSRPPSSSDSESDSQERTQSRVSGATSKDAAHGPMPQNPNLQPSARAAGQSTSQDGGGRPQVRASAKKAPNPTHKNPTSQAGPSTGHGPVRNPINANTPNLAALAGRLVLDSQQTAALRASKITYSTNTNGIDVLDWTPSDGQGIFQMSLAAVARDLGLGSNFQPLTIALETLGQNYVFDIPQQDEARFRDIKEQVLFRITQKHTRTPLTDGLKLRFDISVCVKRE
ncbi:hypothetical protein FDECE_3960 [Fusarium decemcellulare]|nr:hypothetical protein FDECE_3960 [Fusarium decemcellulare]